MLTRNGVWVGRTVGLGAMSADEAINYGLSGPMLRASGVAYEMHIPLTVYEKLPREGAEVELRTYHVVREDSQELFGFLEASERLLFAKLLSASGVGPRLADAIDSDAADLKGLPDEALFERLMRLRTHGGRQTYLHEEVGFNSRLDALQAAVLSAKLPHLAQWSAARRANAARQVREALDRLPPGEHAFTDALDDGTPIYWGEVPKKEDNETTLAELKARIAWTIEFIRKNKEQTGK